MNSKEIKFSLKLIVDGKEQAVTAITTTKRLQQVIDGANTSADKLQKSIFNFNQAFSAWINITTTVSNLNSALSGLAGSYQAVELANTRLKTVMEERMNASQQDVKAVQDAIKAQTQLGILGGSVQKAGAQQVATFLTQREALVTLIPAINDLVAQQKGLAATEQDAQNIGNLFGKVMQGQTSALKRVGITFTEAQEKVLKMGTEQERAAMLAEVVTNNVGHMNQALGNTAAGSMKKFQNYLAGIKVKMGEMANSIQPILSMATSAVVLASSAGGAVVAIKKMVTVFNLTAVAANLAGLKVLWLRTQNFILTGSFTATTASSNMFSASLYGVSTAATVAKVAIRGLLISTGVGAVIAALSMGVEYLVNKLTGATSATNADTTALENNQKTTSRAAKTKQAFADIQQDAAGRYTDEIGKVKLLSSVIHNSNVKYADRMAAIKKLQGIIPSYHAQIAKDGSIFKENASAVDKYVKSLQDLAMAEAVFDKMKSLAKQLIDAQTAANNWGNGVRNRENQIKRLNGGKSSTEVQRDLLTNHTLQGKPSTQSAVTQNGRVDFGQGTDILKQMAGQKQKDNQNKALLSAQNHDRQMQAFYQAKADDIKAQMEGLASFLSPGALSKFLKFSRNGGYVNGMGVPNTQVSPGKGHSGKGGGNITTTDKTTTPPPDEQSIKWYDDEISRIRAEAEATADATKAKEKWNEVLKLQQQRKDLAIKIGIEKPDKVEVKSALEQLQDQLKDAQTEFDNATTIEAKLKASAKVSELQQQIDTATKGQLSIEAEVEPQYVVKGSMADKRQSYQNAQTKASRIQSDFDAGLINKDEAEKQINDLNATINAELGQGVKPFELKVDTTSAKKSFSDFASNMQSTWGAIESGVNSIVNLSDNLDNAKTGWDKFCVAMNAAFSIMNTITAVMQFINLLTGAGAAAKGASAAATATDTAAKTADAAASTAIIAANKATTASYIEMASAAFFAAHAYIPFAGAGIASGFVTQAVATTKAAGLLAMAFANGGIVPGASYSGDRLMARVNSGEMILNRTQQMRLWRIVNTPVVATPQVTTQQGHNMPKLNLETLRQSLQPQVVDVNVRGRLSGRDLQLVMDKRNTITSRS
ncbi:MAG: hypothetical protein SPF85_06315 [Alloprevotella sp.]|nr:hypothetical protein [Alloprevotella sp.]